MSKVFKKVGKVVGRLAPIIAPIALGPAGLGLSGLSLTGASAAAGALGSGLTGGNALIGGIAGGLGGGLGGKIASGLGATGATASAINTGLTGAAIGAQNGLKGALTGGVLGGLGGYASAGGFGNLGGILGGKTASVASSIPSPTSYFTDNAGNQHTSDLTFAPGYDAQSHYNANNGGSTWVNNPSSVASYAPPAPTNFLGDTMVGRALSGAGNVISGLGNSLGIGGDGLSGGGSKSSSSGGLGSNILGLASIAGNLYGLDQSRKAVTESGQQMEQGQQAAQDFITDRQDQSLNLINERQREQEAILREGQQSQLALLQDGQNKQMAQIQPFIDRAQPVANTLQQEILSGDLGGTFGAEDFQADPGYQFRKQEGEQALQRQLSAMGLGQSGAAVRRAMELNQGLADQAYQSSFDRWMSQQKNRYGVLAGQAAQGQQAAGLGANILGNNAQAAVAGNEGIAGVLDPSQQANVLNNTNGISSTLTNIGNIQGLTGLGRTQLLNQALAQLFGRA
jgi:hypothetical protein